MKPKDVAFRRFKNEFPASATSNASHIEKRYSRYTNTLFSIEINPLHYKYIVELLANNANVKAILSNSLPLLRVIIDNEAARPTL